MKKLEQIENCWAGHLRSAIHSLERMIRPINPRYWRHAYEAEKKERLRIAESKWWYKRRLDMLADMQKRMRDPERTLVCDIIANGQLLPDADGSRYGFNSCDWKSFRP